MSWVQPVWNKNSEADLLGSSNYLTAVKVRVILSRELEYRHVVYSVDDSACPRPGYILILIIQP